MQPRFRRLNAMSAPLAAPWLARMCRRLQGVHARVQQFRRLNSMAEVRAISLAYKRLNTGLEGPAGMPGGAGAAVFRRLNVIRELEAAPAHARQCRHARLAMASLQFRRLNCRAQPLVLSSAFRRLNTGNTQGVTGIILFRRLNSCLALLKPEANFLNFLHTHIQRRALGRWHVHTYETPTFQTLNPAKCGVQCFWASKGEPMR